MFGIGQRTTNGNYDAARSDMDPKNLNSAPATPGGDTSSAQALIAVARDTIDVVTAIVRDSVAIGKLEAKRTVASLVPRVVWGAVAVVFGAAGAVMAFVALGYLLSLFFTTTAPVLGIITALLLGIAFFGYRKAFKGVDMSPPQEPAKPASKELPHAATAVQPPGTLS
jgi:hypothetical protein